MDSVGFILLLDLLLTLTLVSVDSTKLEDKIKDGRKAEKDVSCSSTNLYYKEPVTQDPFIVVQSTLCFMDKDETDRSIPFFICDSSCMNCIKHCIVNTANCKDGENMVCNCQKNSENGNVLINVKVPIPDTEQCLLGQLNNSYPNNSLLNITKSLQVRNDSTKLEDKNKDGPKAEKDCPPSGEKKVNMTGVIVCASTVGLNLVISIAVCCYMKQSRKYLKPICSCNQKQVHLEKKDEVGDWNSIKHLDSELTTSHSDNMGTDRRGESAEPEEIGYVEKLRKQQVFKIKDLCEESEYFKLEDENDNANNDCAVTSRPNLNENTTINSREAYDVSINV